MILYSVNTNSEITNYEWSIITIHKSFEGAEKALNLYKKNWEEFNYEKPEFKIITIDTDADSDIIYDCEEV